MSQTPAWGSAREIAPSGVLLYVIPERKGAVNGKEWGALTGEPCVLREEEEDEVGHTLKRKLMMSPSSTT
jgi:hypothetical protein